MDNIEELEEDGSEAAGLCVDGLIAAVSESMAEWKPLLLNENAKSLKSAIVRV